MGLLRRFGTDRKLSSSLELPADMALSPQWKLQPGKQSQVRACFFFAEDRSMHAIAHHQATSETAATACCVHAQFQQGLADPAAKSALIGDWTGTAPGASSSLFTVGQAAAKPAWDAGKAQAKVTETQRVGAAASNAVGGPGRWREDERDGPARNADRCASSTRAQALHGRNMQAWRRAECRSLLASQLPRLCAHAPAGGCPGARKALSSGACSPRRALLRLVGVAHAQQHVCNRGLHSA